MVGVLVPIHHVGNLAMRCMVWGVESIFFFQKKALYYLVGTKVLCSVLPTVSWQCSMLQHMCHKILTMPILEYARQGWKDVSFWVHARRTVIKGSMLKLYAGERCCMLFACFQQHMYRNMILQGRLAKLFWCKNHGSAANPIAAYPHQTSAGGQLVKHWCPADMQNFLGLHARHV